MSKDIVSITQCGFVFVNGTGGTTILGGFVGIETQLGLLGFDLV
jgi:hypothetical protein